LHAELIEENYGAVHTPVDATCEPLAESSVCITLNNRNGALTFILRFESTQFRDTSWIALDKNVMRKPICDIQCDARRAF